MAESIPPGPRAITSSRYDELVASGVLRPALEHDDPLADFPSLKLPPGTAAALIDEDRGDR
ncbi:MAG: hypothetical protein H0U59_01790 [Gemmatimonadaceae bacterium]|nr:hypothetical protein [Gemmatimonadaceae bacterium]